MRHKVIAGVVLEDADFQRLVESRRHERLSFFPVELPPGATKRASVYVEGVRRKTVLRDGHQYRVGAIIHEIRNVLDAVTDQPKVSVVVEHTILMLTDEELARYPRPVHIQYDR